MWEPFQVGEFTIRPYLMDHSAPDAAAFLIEADGKRLFYTGDFRGHGRKGVLLKRLLADPVRDVDCLVMEGSMIGRTEGAYLDERAIEKAISSMLAEQSSYTFVFCSSQNVDRLVSVYRAVKRYRKTLVIDLYTAAVLDKLRSISDSIPQADWMGIRVLWGYYHYQKMKAYDSNLLQKCGKSRIFWKEIRGSPRDMVILTRDNAYFRGTMLRMLAPLGEAKAIYSMWHGYLERTALLQVLRSRHVEFVEVHTSGHAYVDSLKQLARAINPGTVVPIHTFSPEAFPKLLSNVVRLEDGENYAV